MIVPAVARQELVPSGLIHECLSVALVQVKMVERQEYSLHCEGASSLLSVPSQLYGPS